MKKILAILLALSAVALLPSCKKKDETAEGDEAFGSGGRSVRYTYVKQDVQIFKSNGQSTVIVNGSALKTTIDGNAWILQASLDNRVSFILATEYSDDDHKEVYYILDGTDLEKIDGSDEWSNAMLSSSGGGIAYTIEGSDETTLYLYDVGSKQSTMVASSDGYIECTALSPDGRSLTYNLQNKDEDHSYGYFFNGEKRIKIATDVLLFGLSDDGEHIYGATAYDDGDYYLFHCNNRGERVNRIGRLDGDKLSILFNKDHTQILFSCDGRTYISVNGAEGKGFFKDRDISLILPGDATHRRTSEHGVTQPVSDFYNCFYYCDGEIYRIKESKNNKSEASEADDDKADAATTTATATGSSKTSDKGSGSEIVRDEGNYEYLTLASGVSTFYTLTEDASRIYYQTYDGDLKMVMTSWGEDAPDKTIRIASDISRFLITSDYTRVYYTDGDELYSADGSNGKSLKHITDDVGGTFHIGKGDILYFSRDDDLYACSDGESAKKVLSHLDDMETGYLGYCYFMKDNGKVYCSSGSEMPEEILTLN